VRFGRSKTEAQADARDAAFMSTVGVKYPAWAICEALAEYASGKAEFPEGSYAEGTKYDPSNYPIPAEIDALCEKRMYDHNLRLTKLTKLMNRLIEIQK
jgi:hypothetical protein